MSKPEPEPEIKVFDPSTMTIEERLARLEDLINKIATHQVTLGQNLIAAINDINDISTDMLDAGVSMVAQQARTTRPGMLVDEKGEPLGPPSIVQAPGVHPGPHPNRPFRGN